MDEVFIRIRGKTHYLWRAVDQNGHVLDILGQSRRNTKAAHDAASNDGRVPGRRVHRQWPCGSPYFKTVRSKTWGKLASLSTSSGPVTMESTKVKKHAENRPSTRL